jgi:peptide/nickel transport system ATP-binding protein
VSRLEVRGLSKEFRAGGVVHRARLHAVDDVTFSLAPGRITALAGESGSGKSTVARLIARLYDPTAGEVLFDGRDVSASRRRRDVLRYRSQVQLIFQDPFGSLNPAKTVRHHLARPLRIHGLASRRDTRPWMRSGRARWCRTVFAGFKESNGSWKISWTCDR